MVITAGQIVWTAECEKALADADTAKKALRLLKKKWVSYLNKLTAVTRSKLNKIERNKVSSTALCAAIIAAQSCTAHARLNAFDISECSASAVRLFSDRV